MILKFLVTLFSSTTIKELMPWDKGNSEVISATIEDVIFMVNDVTYVNGLDSESITAGITDITFTPLNV